MGHCISIFLIKKSELRSDKIDSVIKEQKSNSTIKWTELNCDLLSTTHIPNLKEFGKDKTVAKITTDYFGGTGNQTAKVFINNEKVKIKSILNVKA